MLSLSRPLFSENEPDRGPKPRLELEFGISERNSGPESGPQKDEKKIAESENSENEGPNPGIRQINSGDSASFEAEQRKNPSREYAWDDLELGLESVDPGLQTDGSLEPAHSEDSDGGPGQPDSDWRPYAWTGLPHWDPGERSGFQPLYSFQALGASDAGGTEKPFHRASGSRGELILGGDFASREFGVLILGAALGQDSLVSRQSQGGLYAGMFWLGSPYISWPQPGEDSFWLRAGYQPMESDALGLLYNVRAPAVSVGQQFQLGSGPLMGFQLHAMDLSDSHPYYSTSQRTGEARYYGGELSFFYAGWLLEFSYGNYRLNGRSARAEGRWQDLILWEGQSAVPVQYVHYSGLALGYSGDDWKLDLQFYRSHGQQSARTAYGGEEFLSRKTIRGWMAAGQLIWNFFPDHSLGLSGLGSSRQRKDAEDFHGFAPLNPVPRLLGGIGSILISARPPFDQSHPLSNRRFYDSFPSSHRSENGRNVNEGVVEHDLLVPDHANRGIRMGGLSWEHQVFSRWSVDGYLSVYLNRAEFKEAQGTEGVLVLDLQMDNLNLTFSAAGAYISPSAETPDPYTGFIPSAKRRYFSRYVFYFLLPLS